MNTPLEIDGKSVISVTDDDEGAKKINNNKMQEVSSSCYKH